MNPGQQAHMQSESQSRLEYVWAKKMLTKPPDLGPNSPFGLLLFYFLSLFNLFSLFLLLINQPLIFLIKIRKHKKIIFINFTILFL